jgi:RloB-like protein
MGSEDRFHKRKARKNAELGRQKKERAQLERYLIVCEGTKTEPFYLRYLAEDLGILPSVLKIAQNNGSSPDRVVAHGIKLYNDDAKSGDSFDQVFFVFDRDTHSTYDAAVQRVKDCADTDKPFKAITSVPCFEYWLLLHFGYTDKSFKAVGQKSACDDLISVLRTKPGFKNYGKGNEGVYALVKDKTDVAMRAAAKGLANAKKIGEENPSTRMHELIAELLKVSKAK